MLSVFLEFSSIALSLLKKTWAFSGFAFTLFSTESTVKKRRGEGLEKAIATYSKAYPFIREQVTTEHT